VNYMAHPLLSKIFTPNQQLFFTGLLEAKQNELRETERKRLIDNIVAALVHSDFRQIRAVMAENGSVDYDEQQFTTNLIGAIEQHQIEQAKELVAKPLFDKLFRGHEEVFRRAIQRSSFRAIGKQMSASVDAEDERKRGEVDHPPVPASAEAAARIERDTTQKYTVRIDVPEKAMTPHIYILRRGKLVGVKVGASVLRNGVALGAKEFTELLDRHRLVVYFEHNYTYDDSNQQLYQHAMGTMDTIFTSRELEAFDVPQMPEGNSYLRVALIEGAEIPETKPDTVVAEADILVEVKGINDVRFTDEELLDIDFISARGGFILEYAEFDGQRFGGVFDKSIKGFAKDVDVLMRLQTEQYFPKKNYLVAYGAWCPGKEYPGEMLARKILQDNEQGIVKHVPDDQMLGVLAYTVGRVEPFGKQEKLSATYLDPALAACPGYSNYILVIDKCIVEALHTYFAMHREDLSAFMHKLFLNMFPDYNPTPKRNGLLATGVIPYPYFMVSEGDGEWLNLGESVDDKIFEENQKSIQAATREQGAARVRMIVYDTGELPTADAVHNYTELLEAVDNVNEALNTMMNVDLRRFINRTVIDELFSESKSFSNVHKELVDDWEGLNQNFDGDPARLLPKFLEKITMNINVMVPLTNLKRLEQVILVYLSRSENPRAQAAVANKDIFLQRFSELIQKFKDFGVEFHDIKFFEHVPEGIEFQRHDRTPTLLVANISLGRCAEQAHNALHRDNTDTVVDISTWGYQGHAFGDNKATKGWLLREGSLWGVG